MMQPIEKNGYTKQQIIDMLHYKNTNRITKIRYDLLDRDDNYKCTLNNVLSGEVSMDNFAKIKRTARLTLKENKNINIDWLNDRIQPFVLFKMPNSVWIEYSMGIFLLSSPIRKEENNKIYRDIEAYDKTIILQQGKTDNRYTVTKGTNYIDAIKTLLQSTGINKINIAYVDKILPITREWEIGISKLNIINSLLQEINYNSLYFDEYGYAVSSQYVLPFNRPIEYTYKDNDLSIIFDGVSEELDLFNAPNKFVVTCSNAEQEALISTYINNNVNSITSVKNRGRVITDIRQIDNIADQQSLDSYTKKIAYNASKIYSTVEFETALMPMHGYLDILFLKYSSLKLNDKYKETSWSMQLEAGSKMKHKVRKVVQI